ncbi:Transcriptional protein SWT1 [Merluccius polli]|uniref:Transcriptional protein SWT1 n=1 Tax=Merluccius polli TaxID=89951 RepID=A0AA47MY02_MERPO|nr:Transcriptional protein SWT1 [Merluccius polli]
MGNPDCVERMKGWMGLQPVSCNLGETPLVGLLGLGETPHVGLLGPAEAPHAGVTGGHRVSKDKNAKRQESGNSHDRPQQKECPPPSSKDKSNSHRHFKEAVYKLSKTQSSEQRPVENEVGRSRTKTVDIPSGEKTSSRRTKSDPSDQTVESGQRSSHSKDARRQTTEATAKHDPHIKSSQKASSKSIRPAEYKPPPLTSTIPRNACKRKADAARGTTTEEPSTTTASSAKKSKAKEGWKEFDKPHEDEKGDPPGAKHSLSAPPRRTKRWSSISTTRATSDQKPKQPSLTPSQGHVTPLSPCVQGAGGSLTPSRPPVQFKIPKKTRPTSSVKCDVDNNAKEHNEKGRRLRDLLILGLRDLLILIALMAWTLKRLDLSKVRSIPFISEGTRWKRNGVAPTDLAMHQHATIIHTGASITDDNDHEMQAVEAVHQAVHQPRSESRLEVQSYRELTRMDTDAPDNGDNYTFKNDIILVLDTNILLSHLDYVKKIRSHGLGGMGFAVVLVPWVVLQELDSLKNSKRPGGLCGPPGHPCRRLHLQLSEEAGAPPLGASRLNAENNDDRVLQCCLQYQTLYPESALILCTNDKNLCSKALLSRVKALCKADLEEKSGRLHHDTALPTLPIPLPRHLDSQDPSSGNRRSGLGQRAPETGEEPGAWGRRVCLCVARLEDCLKEALSHILEVEMKAAYEDLWKDIVYLKPPWELPDVLRCMRKHWIAVFGNIVPRGQLQAVENLHDFFTPGKTVEQDSVLAALREAGELLDVFGKTRESYGGRVSTAVGTLVTIERQLLAQPEQPEHVPDEPLVGDAVMSDREEKQAPPPQVSHQDVWALFENIWANLCQISSAMFAALHFDPGAMRSVRPEGAPPPPEDALACLHNLLPMVTQLLQAFSRVLSSDVGMEESQALLSFIHASQIVSLNTRLSTSDLIVCFSQQEYR